MKQLFLPFVVSFVFLVFVLPIFLPTTQEFTEVDATVTECTYVSAHVVFVPTANGLVTTRPVPEQYLVTVTYQNFHNTFHDEDLYKSVTEGDTVKVFLYRGYNKYHLLLQEELRLQN